MPDPNLARRMAEYQMAVIEADALRVDQAWELAYDQLGLPPCPHAQPEEHVHYVNELATLASQIMARPN